MKEQFKSPEAQRQPDTLIAYSIRDTAERLCLSERSVHRLVASGALGSIKAGRRRLIPRESIKQLLTGQAA